MAEFNENEIYFGFRLQKIEEINDIHSIIFSSHEKSGARLLYLKLGLTIRFLMWHSKRRLKMTAVRRIFWNIPCFAVRESMKRS